MATKIIVSYDGTDNDRDALALGQAPRRRRREPRARVRPARDGGRERSAERLAEQRGARSCSRRGARARQPGRPTHVVLSGSTPDGLRELALEPSANAIVFGSEYRTAPGHVDPQASARRLIDGGPIAVAIAPSGFHERAGYTVATIAAVGEDGDPCALETAEALAAELGATVADRATATSA